MNTCCCKQIYPFIEEFVENFYTENINNFINNSVKNPIDKNTMLMYIAMYFMIYLKLDSKCEKDKIKETMNTIVKNPDLRHHFIKMFNSVQVGTTLPLSLPSSEK